MNTIKTEIGSEFWSGCTPFSELKYSMRPDSVYKSHPYRVLETLSGRTALEYVVETLCKRGKKSVYLPSYCCQTMIKPFLCHGMIVKFYDVKLRGDSLTRVLSNDVDYDAILLMDYFGHTDAETLEIAIKEKKKDKIVIYDATHSMYSTINTEIYDFVYGSYRKWLDINCGFLAWSENESELILTQNNLDGGFVDTRVKFFELKSRFMRGEKVSKEEFLPLIEEAEQSLEESYHHKAPDERSVNLLRDTDAEYIKFRRRSNARVLIEALIEMNDDRIKCINPLLGTLDTPLFVPVIVSPSHRNELRKYLIENDIYCPVHWPLSELHVTFTGSSQLFESELSLICDQRYTEEHMFRIVNKISDYLNRK